MAVLHAEYTTGILPGEFPIPVEMDRHRLLDSPFFFASEIVDPWYGENFEYKHQQLLDEVLAPWCLGETVKIEGIAYNPHDYVGLFVPWPRGTYKSSICKLIAAWYPIRKKLRDKMDVGIAYIHQVLDRAVAQGEGIRSLARGNHKFRKTLPEFSVPLGEKDWDTKQKWSWPCVASEYRQTGSFSFEAFGEKGSKIGGHFHLRLVDDWETDESVTTPQQIQQSERAFRALDNLKIRGIKHNPWIVVGTYYHYDGPYRRLEKTGGWLTWKVPAHMGSPQTIFDLAKLDPRDEKDARRIESGLRKLERERSADLMFPKTYPWRELYKSCIGQRASDDGDGLSGSHYEYSTQILLDPVPMGQQRFDREQLARSWVDEIPGPTEMYVFIRVDPAISNRKKSDDMCVAVAGVKWDRTRWFVDGWIGKERRPVVQVRTIFNLARKWQSKGYRVLNIGIESVAYQEALAMICRDGVPETDAVFDGQAVPIVKAPCPIRSIERPKDATKQERILSMDGPITRGDLKIYRKNPIGKHLYQQLWNFPQDKDDALDTAHDMWVQTVTPPRAIEIERKLHPDIARVLARRMKQGRMTNSVRLVGA